MLSFLESLPEITARFTELSIFENRDETIIWHGYEHLIWSVGEVFRQILKREKSLRRSKLLWSKIEAISLDSKYDKGRQSFAMLLGLYGGHERVPVLIQLLEDPVIHGHALYALRRLGANGAEEQARTLLHSPRAWIRREARDYLEKMKKRELKGRK